MPTILINAEAEDYDHWRNFFDEGEKLRTEHGVQSSRVFQGTDSPNEFAILMECEDLEKMRELAEHPDFIEANEQARVDPDTSQTFLLQEVEE